MSLANIGVPGLIVILLIVVILFGGKRIAEVAKGLGTGVKNFKNAVKDGGDEETDEVQPQEPKVIAKPKKTAAKTTKSTAKKTTKTAAKPRQKSAKEA